MVNLQSLCRKRFGKSDVHTKPERDLAVILQNDRTKNRDQFPRAPVTKKTKKDRRMTSPSCPLPSIQSRLYQQTNQLDFMPFIQSSVKWVNPKRANEAKSFGIVFLISELKDLGFKGQIEKNKCITILII